jgi:predicted aspartyl protease
VKYLIQNIFFFCIFNLSAVSIQAGEPVADSSRLPAIDQLIDPVVSSDSADCIIPFTRAGNLILLKASIDSIEGNFVLDTGAPHLILNMTYFRDYPTAPPEGDEEPGGITGTAGRSLPAAIPNLQLGPIRYAKLRADRINLGHIENSRGVKILGLLGVQLFKRFEMIIDYENSRIHLHLISRKEASSYQSTLLKDPATYNTFPIQLLENKLLTNVTVAGKKLIFVIDTGAESNVLDSRLPNRILENVAITRRVILIGSGSSKVEALYGDVNEMKMGELSISKLPVLITNLEKLCFSYDRCIDGMLGFDFLSMQKIGFNFVRNKMYIWK